MDAFVTRKRARSPPPPQEPETKKSAARNPSISPPPKRNLAKTTKIPRSETIDLTSDISPAEIAEPSNSESTSIKLFPSPIQLNHIPSLPASSNTDTLSLRDILRDPLIKECWLFNYLFEMDFVMKQFDPDTRDQTVTNIVHGSWKAEDRNGIGIQEAARCFPNIRVIKAYMPEAFGTHHSKMIVLFRHDETAQVIILTANFIERDWSMSQALWRTPLLPLMTTGVEKSSSQDSLPALGSGARFKHDLLAYFRGYGSDRLRDLVSQMQGYDFSEVRGALVASVPGKQHIQSMVPECETLWGWPGLKRILNRIPTSQINAPHPISQPHIIAQVSSVAAVGEKWFTNTFLPALSTTAHSRNLSKASNPKISIIFPTADEVRRSVDGYTAGASIHTKISSATQVKQLDFLRPMLCHWAGDEKAGFFGKAATNPVREAGRRRAAPHIKTYIRFSDTEMKTIDWAMVTSANLSTQAWGAALTGVGEVRICSYEIGVVVWPRLWAEEDGSHVEMVPVFKNDSPNVKNYSDPTDAGESKIVVGWRMPYDLPLVPYGAEEKPWCATEAHSKPDWKGQIWLGYEK